MMIRLFPFKNWRHFIEKAYQKFIEIEPKEYIRQAIQYTIYREGRTVENSFLTLYSAIESLVEHFGLRPNIIDQEQFKNVFTKDLRKWIRKHPLFLNQEGKRRSIYEKISELNRVSFSSAFNNLCNSVYLEDLWPVVKRTKEISLSEIRNRLVHGDTYFNHLEQKAVSTAEKHLRWTAERLILSALGWNGRNLMLARIFFIHELFLVMKSGKPTKKFSLVVRCYVEKMVSALNKA